MKNVIQLFLSIVLLYILSVISVNRRVYAAPSGCAGGCPSGWSCSSFLPGTQIATGEGSTVKIEDLRIGDNVFSFDEALGVAQTSKIRQIIYGKRNEYYEITTDNGSVSASANHPFYVGGGYKSWDPLVAIEYKRADELHVGDVLYTLNRSIIEPIKIDGIQKHIGPVGVYTLSVEGNENFFANTYAVHNKFCYQRCPYGPEVNQGCGANGCPSGTKRVCYCTGSGYGNCRCVPDGSCRPPPTPTPTPAPTPSPRRTPPPTPPPRPAASWWQVCGSAIAGTDIRSMLPNGQKLVSCADGGVVAFGGSVNTNSQPSGSTADINYSVSQAFTARNSYALFKRRVTNKVTPNLLAGNILTPGIPASDGYIYWQATGTVTLPAQNIGTDKVVLLSDGAVNITGNLTFTDGQGLLVILAGGNITLDGSVATLKGIYLAQGTFNTGASANQLQVDGTVVGLTDVVLSRTFTTGSQPAEIFIYRPEYVDMLPPALLRRKILMQEVAP